VKPLLNEAQWAKINIFRTHEVHQGMRQFIAEDQIPAEYGGLSRIPLGMMEEEQNLRRQVFANLTELNVPLVTDDQLRNPDDTPASIDKYVYRPRRAI